MPTCRFCSSVYPRNQFIHGNGPKAQVCVRCGLEKGMVTEDEVPSFYSRELSNSRFSIIARYWSPVLWLMAVWGAWAVLLLPVKPWGVYTLVLLALATLGLPVYMFLNRVKYLANIARLTPAYQTPPGH
jgi:hypothetical protein